MEEIEIEVKMMKQTQPDSHGSWSQAALRPSVGRHATGWERGYHAQQQGGQGASLAPLVAPPLVTDEFKYEYHGDSPNNGYKL